MASKEGGISKGKGIGVAELLALLDKAKEVEFGDVEIVAEELTFELIPTVLQMAPTLAPPVEKPLELLKTTFEPPVSSYVGQIAEVQIGATGREGGTRGRVIKVGGEKCPPFHKFECATINRPIVALDVFDLPPPIPKTIKDYYRDVLDDHVAWINKCIDVFGADLVTLHLVSTDPSSKNTPATEAAKFVDQIFDKVDDPLIVGGSGDPKKDLEVFDAVAKTIRDERAVLASATVDVDLQKMAKIVMENNQNVVALGFLDINQVKELNSKLIEYGIEKTHLITDPSTGGLGYGIEYTFSMMERIRLAGLMGDPIMQVPISCAATNGWAAREAWAKIDEWGPREHRGPLWEAVTGLMGLFAGADLFMMMHPLAAKILKNVSDVLSKHSVRKDLKEIPYENWVTMRI